MKKILVIEDNIEVNENLCEILELAGYETISTHNGKEGLAYLKEELPDLIICDVMMPELDGFGVLKILNQNPRYLSIPFIFLTAKAEKSDLRKGMGLGATDYITKPFDDVELLESIEVRLKKSATLSTIPNSNEGIQTFYNEAKARVELNDLTEDREIRTYQSKTQIYGEEQIPRYLYFLMSGEVKICRKNDIGKEIILKLANGGEFFGYQHLLTQQPYDQSAIALSEVNVTLIPKDDFQKILFTNRDIASKFIQMLSNNVLTTQEQLLQIAYSSVRKKVAQAILQAYEASPQTSIQLRRDDLAALAATAKETLIRTLTDFKNEGLIKIDNGHITILDKPALTDMPQ